MSLPGSSEEAGIIVLPMDRDPEKLKDILRYYKLFIVHSFFFFLFLFFFYLCFMHPVQITTIDSWTH